MQPVDQLAQMASDINVRRVFGESYERDGVTIIPVATVRGGGGVGRREQPGEEARRGDPGGGLGLVARPAGVYVLKDGKVRWVPAVDVNRAILGGQVVAIAIMLLLRRAMAPKVFRLRRGPLPLRLARFLSRRRA